MHSSMESCHFCPKTVSVNFLGEKWNRTKNGSLFQKIVGARESDFCQRIHSNSNMASLREWIVREELLSKGGNPVNDAKIIPGYGS